MRRQRAFTGFDYRQRSFKHAEGCKRNADSSKKKGIQALVVQNPKKMGHEAVKALVTKMKGETVPTVITKENLDTPEIQALLACFFAVFA